MADSLVQYNLGQAGPATTASLTSESVLMLLNIPRAQNYLLNLSAEQNGEKPHANLIDVFSHDSKREAHIQTSRRPRLMFSFTRMLVTHLVLAVRIVTSHKLSPGQAGLSLSPLFTSGLPHRPLLAARKAGSSLRRETFV
jgi:hypothetical protein